MTNSQYTEKTLASVQRILVDTSTLMTPGFQRFISNNKELLATSNQKIIVPKAVYTELARHMGSEDSDKSEHAMAAVDLLALNKDIFQVESAALSEDEIAHAFADAQLLSELTLHRSDYSQLLITNDRKLSCDAFDLNQQQSCKGRKVLVCYINWCGELQCCECARPSAERTAERQTSCDFENNTVSSSRVPETNPEEVAEGTWEFDWLSGLLSLSSAGIIYGLYRGGKALLRNIA